MKIVYSKDNKSVSIVTPADADADMLKIGKMSVPNGVPFWVVEDDFIPTDREFRDSWELDTEAMGEPSGHGEQK